MTNYDMDEIERQRKEKEEVGGLDQKLVKMKSRGYQ